MGTRAIRRGRVGARARRAARAWADDAAPLVAAQYCCRRCGARVALAEARIAVAGDVRHRGVNPAGWPHDFLTFAACDGLALVGAPSLEATWFTGHAWQIAACAECGRDLGWRFTAVDGARSPASFWGLRVDELAPA